MSALDDQSFRSDFALAQAIFVDEWLPSGFGTHDGLCMHDALYPGHNIQVMGEIIRDPIQHFDGLIELELRRLVADCEPGSILRILDYGSGTGLVIFELIKLLEKTGLGEQIQARCVSFEIYAVDLPNPWFFVGRKLLQKTGCVKFYSLIDGHTNKILLLDQIFPEKSIDLIISSMVFHLIPEKALSGLFRASSRILSPEGSLVWNSPDLVEDSPLGFKMHTPYRMLRETVTGLLTRQGALETFLDKSFDSPAHVLRFLRSHMLDYRKSFNPECLAELDAFANAYIKPDERVPSPERLHASLREVFAGHRENRYFPIGEASLYPPIFVPSNENYINQLPPGLLRTWLINVILHDHVIPELLRR